MGCKARGWTQPTHNGRNIASSQSFEALVVEGMEETPNPRVLFLVAPETRIPRGGAGLHGPCCWPSPNVQPTRRRRRRTLLPVSMGTEGTGGILRLMGRPRREALQGPRAGPGRALTFGQQRLVGMVGWIRSGSLEMARMVSGDHPRWPAGLVQRSSEAMDRSPASRSDPGRARSNARQTRQGPRPRLRH